jgi:hypothetical protein
MRNILKNYPQKTIDQSISNTNKKWTNETETKKQKQRKQQQHTYYEVL